MLRRLCRRLPKVSRRCHRSTSLFFSIVFLHYVWTSSQRSLSCSAFTSSVPSSSSTSILRRGNRGTLAFRSKPTARKLSESAAEPSDDAHSATAASLQPLIPDKNVWEQLACIFVDVDREPSRLKEYVQYVTVLRVALPSLAGAAFAKTVYPTIAMTVAGLIHDSGVFAVVAQDASQYIQNILTTSGLVFSLLVGQTYFFMVSNILFSLLGFAILSTPALKSIPAPPLLPCSTSSKRPYTSRSSRKSPWRNHS